MKKSWDTTIVNDRCSTLGLTEHGGVEFIQSNPEPRELKRALGVQMVLKGYVYRQVIGTVRADFRLVS